MPPRSTRRRGGPQRWLIIPFVVTTLVLLVDASMHARSTQFERALDSQDWVDAVLPEITASTAQGLELANITQHMPAGPAGAIAEEISGIASQAASTYRAVRSDNAPPDLATAAGLLQACLVAREQGAQQFAAGVQHLLEGDKSTLVIPVLSGAAGYFQLSDSAYQLFAKDLPELGTTMPASLWIPGAGAYQPASLASFTKRLVAAVAKTPAQPLLIDEVTTDPRALSTEEGVEVLSPASSISVTAVVADSTQIAQQGVWVSATISPSGGAPSQRVVTTVDLNAGQAKAVNMPGLTARLSTVTELTVSAGLTGGAAADTRQLRIIVPGPDFSGVPTTALAPLSSTTSTPGGATSTTGPGGGGGSASASTTQPAATTTTTSSAPAVTTVPTTVPATSTTTAT